MINLLQILSAVKFKKNIKSKLIKHNKITLVTRFFTIWFMIFKILVTNISLNSILSQIYLLFRRQSLLKNNYCLKFDLNF